jgi:exosortase
VYRRTFTDLAASLKRPVSWLLAGLLALCAWVYWPTFAHLSRVWATTPEYSHGFLVPLFAGFLLYRRSSSALAACRPEGWGLLLVLAGGGFLLTGAYLGMDFLEAASLLPVLGGLLVLFGGRPALRWAWPGLLFLLFMIPLPFRLATAVADPLRTVATQASGYALQALGLPVAVEGHTLLIDDDRIAIAEACSGLSMLFVFAALASAVAIVSKRPALDRALVVLSAAPIAIAANVFRISLTAVAYRTAGKGLGDFIFHDLAGWLMTPVALALLYLELKLLDRILVPADDQEKDSAAANLAALLFPKERSASMSAESPSAPVKGPAISPSRGKTTKSGLDPWAFVAAIRRRLLPALLLGALLGGAGAALVWFFLPPGNHTATRVLHVSATPQVLYSEAQQRSDFQTFKATQIALIRSRIVLNAALRSPKVAQSDWIAQTTDPLEWLEKEVKVTFPNSPEIMHVSIAGPESQLPILTALVDAIVEAYLNEIVDKDHQMLVKRHEHLKVIAKRYEDKVKGIRDSMKQLREKAGTGKRENLALMQQLALKDRDNAAAELSRLRADIRVLKAQLAQTKEGKATDERSLAKESVDLALEGDAPLQKMKESANELQGTITHEAGKTRSGLKAPAVQALVKQLEEQQAAIKRREDKVRKATLSRLQQEKKGNTDLGPYGMKQRLNELEGLEKLTLLEVERLNRIAKAKNLEALSLEDFSDELAEADSMRASLVKKAEVLAIESEAPPRINRLDQEPVINSPDERMRKLKFAGGAFAGAFALMLLAVGFLELQTQRVTSASEVAANLGMPVVGVLPFYKASKGGARAAQQLKESVDHARTVLLHQAQANGLKVVMVTSAASGEGKTSLACHLAASLARAGCNTLLIDGDLRKPDAHNVFTCPNAPGLCEVLRGEVRPDQAVQDAGLAGLRLLPAGRCCDATLSALAQRAFGAALASLRMEYDFIIVDSSPVLGVPDALMLGKHSDGVLFAVMQGETRAYRLATAADRFARLDAPILGMIVNGASNDEHYATGPYGRTLVQAPASQQGGKP